MPPTTTQLATMRSATRLGVWRWLLVGLSLLGALHARPAFAQRSEYLVRMLTTSSTFRVRVQAAVSLGRTDATEAGLNALKAGLEDEHPAVRTACAASLERLEDPSTLPALRAVRRDSHRGARRAIASAIRALERVAARGGSRGTEEPSGGPARFYVGIGEPGNQANVDAATLRRAREYLREQVQGMEGVSLAPANESNRAARRALQRNRLTGYYIDASIVRVEETSAGTRVVVSVIVNTYPGRDMRAILNGAATVPGAGGPRAVTAAMEGALRSATRRLVQAMESSRR